MDLREIFALNLRRQRHRKGLSQEELADAADINRTYVSKLETAATWVGLEIIDRLSKALEISPADLLKSPKKQPKRLGSRPGP
jgi:transcriptional regulator with XRE-family HTH domain